MPSNEERLATLEEHKRAVEQTIRCLNEYMREGRSWREDTTTKLAIVVNNQEGMKEYQVRCDAARDNINIDAENLEKRVTVTEGFQKRQMKYGIIFALLIGGSGTAAPKLIQKIMDIMS